jgi:hypothetical protein
MARSGAQAKGTLEFALILRIAIDTCASRVGSPVPIPELGYYDFVVLQWATHVRILQIDSPIRNNCNLIVPDKFYGEFQV